MNPEIGKRLAWVELYQATKNAGLTCSRCGISRPTLRKWVNRFNEFGIHGLESQSRRPHCSPAIQITEEVEEQIIHLRKEKNLGARRIQNELKRMYDFHLSIASIHKVLKRRNVPPLYRPRRPLKPKRYAKSLPGECVQLDTIKIASGIYQYTAIDDADIIPSDFVFHTSRGTPFSPRNLLRYFKAALRKTGLSESIRIHDLRHPFVFFVDTNPAQRCSGASRSQPVSTTMGIYGHLMPGAQEKAAQAMETYFREK